MDAASITGRGVDCWPSADTINCALARPANSTGTWKLICRLSAYRIRPSTPSIVNRVVVVPARFCPNSVPSEPGTSGPSWNAPCVTPVKVGPTGGSVAFRATIRTVACRVPANGPASMINAAS